MSSLHFGLPGTTAALTTSEAEVLWGGDASRIEVLRQSKIFVSTMADAANTPTTVIRKGMLVGVITSTGKVKEWNPDGSDGSEFLAGVLGVELQMTDRYGTAVDKHGPIIVKAPLKASALRIEGTALVGHTDEYFARRQLALLGCRLDDDPQGFLSGFTERIQTKATNYTVTAADNGKTFVQITADATFTLPTIKAGLTYRFIQSADFEIVVASVAGDDMLVGNDASADSVTFTTAGQQIGAIIEVRAIYVGTTLKWLVTLPPAPFGVGAATLAYAIGT